MHAASFGYLLADPFAAALVGPLAARGSDRTVLRTTGTMAPGLLVIHAFGLPWLMVTLHVSLAKVLALGVTPILLGGAIKVALAPGCPSLTCCAERTARYQGWVPRPAPAQPARRA